MVKDISGGECAKILNRWAKCVLYVRGVFGTKDGLSS